MKGKRISPKGREATLSWALTKGTAKVKERFLRLLAVLGMSAIPLVVNATPVSWLIQGQLDTATGQLGSFVPSAGQAFSFILHFDSATSVTNPGVCGSGGEGTTCRHNSGLNQYFSNIVIGGTSFGDFLPNPAGNNLLVVRNNAADPDFGDTVDGYSWRTQKLDASSGEYTNFDVLFRGPEDLNLVTDGRVLPIVPPASLLSLRSHIFQLCDADSSGACTYAFLSGTITSVSQVPEPGTLALLGLGLTGLAALRRRRAR